MTRDRTTFGSDPDPMETVDDSSLELLDRLTPSQRFWKSAQNQRRINMQQGTAHQMVLNVMEKMQANK
jgi:hypothetical protein